MFPNFIIAGAPKCGTTSLFFLLKQHPDICFSEPKEPRLFTMHWGNDTSYYRIFFPDYKGQKLIGEASGSYFSNPEVPQRIFQTNPEMKLIFIFRNPLQQLLSFYWMRVRHGLEQQRWDEAIKRGVSGDPLFQYSFYYQNLSRFLKYIPKENIHIIIFEDFKNNPQKELNSVCSFLNIDPFIVKIDRTWQNKGDATKSIKLSYLIYKVRTSAFTKKLPRFLWPLAKSSRQLVEWFNKKNMNKTLKGEDIQYLKNLFHSDVKSLENHLGKPLPWNI